MGIETKVWLWFYQRRHWSLTIWTQWALLSCKVFSLSLLPSASLFIPEWPLWIMRCSKGSRDNGSSFEAANRHWDKVIQHLTRRCSVFASSPEQRDGSLLINADSLKSTLCRHINNKLFKCLCMLLEKVTESWKEGRLLEWRMGKGMTTGLKDNLAWFHTLYLQCLSYLKVLRRKITHFWRVLISYFFQHKRIF